jgi:cardiolipin synthase A/B
MSVPSVTRRYAIALGASGILSGCSTVPHIDGLPPSAIGINNRVAPPATDDADALQQQYELQRDLSQAPLVSGNRVTLLTSGHEVFRAIFSAIRSAKSSVNLEYFILADVVSDGVRLSEILLARLRAGVVVNILYDSYGSADTPADFFNDLRNAGAAVVEFNPVSPLRNRVGWSPNDRDHRKIAVIDGRIGFTGGVNLDHVYENPISAGMPRDGDTSKAYWRDAAVQLEGPAVAELQRLFFATWQSQNGPTPRAASYFPSLPRVGVQTVRIIGSAPGDRQPLYYASLITAMKAARRRVWLCSGYFIPPHQEREELAKIARAGLDVRIICPSQSDVPSAVSAARASYGDLLEAGVKIYEVHDAVLHAKLTVVDNTWTVVGSSNLDNRSLIFNNEVDAVILGSETALQVEALMRQFMAAAHEIDLKTWRSRSFQEHIRELKARVWQYWM